MFDPQKLTNMQPITKEPKIPTPELCTADAQWREANKFDTWAIDVLDYLMVHHIRPEDDEFFFFCFYSHLTPHSPPGMAGGPIRTPTRGASYIHTKQNLQKPEARIPPPHTHSHPYIHGMRLSPDTLSHANQDPIQGDKENFHPAPNKHLSSFPFHSISPPPLIVQPLP